MKVVTGIGPRVGTSFVMHEAYLSGLPVVGELFPWYVDKRDNPNGFYEMPWDEEIKPSDYRDTVIKLWDPWPFRKRIQRLVIIEREDKEAQLKSMKTVNEKIRFDQQTHLDIIEHFLEQKKRLIKIPHFFCYTEELDNKIKDIISYLGD